MRSISACLLILFAATAAAGEPVPRVTDQPACMDDPVSQFGRYVGDWQITDEQLARDGSGWGPGNGARWIFECVGNGIAIQDHWLPTGGGYGTNLRTYNPDTGKWEIVWAASNLNGLMQISAAINDEGNIVMHTLSPKMDPPRRIIFFAPDDKGWSWVQQWSLDDGESWTDVYRIRATPWKD